MMFDGEAPTSFTTLWPMFASAKMAIGRGDVPGGYGNAGYQRAAHGRIRLPASVPQAATGP